MAESDVGFPCSVARVADIIGDPWTPLLVRDALLGVRRYDDFRRSSGIARTTLSTRLRRLVDAGILETRLYQNNPPRNEYVLTVKGRELWSVLGAMLAWGDRWLDDGSGPPVAVRHLACGQDDVRLDTVCSACGAPAPATDVEWHLGSGFPASIAERPDVTLRFGPKNSPERTAAGHP